MKKLLFVSILFFSFGCSAQLVCPKPQELSADGLEFYDVTTIDNEVSSKAGTSLLFIGSGLFEVDNKIWQLSVGYFDENRPRRQARRLLEKANPPTIEYDKEENEEYCVYLKNLDKKIPEFITASFVPKAKPCPSLERMKATPFTEVEEICNKNHPGCGDYCTTTQIEDRGTNWVFISFVYKDLATAMSETEMIKEKAYKPTPSEGEDAVCTYFIGATKRGVRGILAISIKPDNQNVKETINNIMYKKIRQVRHMVVKG